ncbi:MAG: hypothetical protein M3Z04_16635 [Chloroflexota bacterium]|nr:hypothetical protein [Chloroflexota bacterium]
MTLIKQHLDALTDPDIPAIPAELEAAHSQWMQEVWTDVPPEYRAQVIKAAYAVREAKAALAASVIEAGRQGQIRRNGPLLELLDSWTTGDEAAAQDQRETWAYLKQALEESRSVE